MDDWLPPPLPSDRPEEEWLPPPLPSGSQQSGLSWLNSFSAEPVTEVSPPSEIKSSPSESAVVAKRRQKKDCGKELRKAAGDGDYAACAECLNDGVDVDDPDNGGRTALHNAARGGHPRITQLLLDSRAEPNGPDKHGCRPLDEVLYWQAKTASPGTRTSEDYSRVIDLLTACGAVSSPGASQRQITNGEHCENLAPRSRAKKNDTDPGKVLRKAAEEGNMDTCLEMLQRGTHVDCQDNGGRTALHNAARGGQAAIVALLVDWKADVNKMEKHGSLPCDEADYWYAKVKTGYASRISADAYFDTIKLLMDFGAVRSNVAERQKLDPSFARRLKDLEVKATNVGETVPWRMPRLLDSPHVCAPMPAETVARRSDLHQEPEELKLGLYQAHRQYFEDASLGYLPVNVGDEVEVTHGKPVPGEPTNNSAWYVYGRSGSAKGWLPLDALRCKPPVGFC